MVSLSLPPASQPGYVSMRDDVERQVRAHCADWPVPLNESELAVELTPAEFNSADTNTGVANYHVPWDIVLAGMVAGGRGVVFVAAAVRQRRPRP